MHIYVYIYICIVYVKIKIYWGQYKQENILPVMDTAKCQMIGNILSERKYNPDLYRLFTDRIDKSKLWHH